MQQRRRWRLYIEQLLYFSCCVFQRRVGRIMRAVSERASVELERTRRLIARSMTASMNAWLNNWKDECLEACLADNMFGLVTR